MSSDLEHALAGISPGNTSVQTLRAADAAIPDLPRRLVAALSDETLSLGRSLDGPPDAALSFGLLAVVKWLGELSSERLADVPAAFFEALLDDPDKKLRAAAAIAIARYTKEALSALSARAGAKNT